MLHFVHTGQIKKNGLKKLGECWWGDGLSEGLQCSMCLGIPTTITFLLVWCTGAHWTEADLAPLAGGSFLLATVCHVNGCKDIIRPISPDRPQPQARETGVHINPHRILCDNRVGSPGSLPLLGARESWQRRGKTYLKMNACHTQAFDLCD